MASTVGTNNEIHVGVKEAARRLGVSTRYLRKLEADGRIPTARRSFHSRGVYGRIYDENDLRMLQALGVGSKPARLRTLREVLEGYRE